MEHTPEQEAVCAALCYSYFKEKVRNCILEESPFLPMTHFFKSPAYLLIKIAKEAWYDLNGSLCPFHPMLPLPIPESCFISCL